MVMIAAALVGAIGIGGGLAYGYKTFLGSSGTDTPPIIRSQSEPSKIKPDQAGGKKFAHTDSKILGRLNDGSSAAAPSGTSQVSQPATPPGVIRSSAGQPRVDSTGAYVYDRAQQPRPDGVPAKLPKAVKWSGDRPPPPKTAPPQEQPAKAPAEAREGRSPEQGQGGRRHRLDLEHGHAV
jgi:hypothetical protein